MEVKYQKNYIICIVGTGQCHTQLESKHPDFSYHTVILVKKMVLMECMKIPKLVPTNVSSVFSSGFSSAPWKHTK